MTDQIWEKLNSLTGDAQNAAIAKAKELNFDLNKGFISFDESLINLNADVATLRDAIEKRKLQQLPLSIQKLLHDDLEKISRFLAGLISGTDEVINLVESIEALHTNIWKLGIEKLSDEYLGYQTKINQIKNLEVELGKLRTDFEQGIATKAELDTVLTSAKQVSDSLTTQLDELKQIVGKASKDGENATEIEKQAATSLKVIQSNQETIAGQLSSTTTSAGEISSQEKKIKEFYQEIDQYRTSINDTTETAGTTLKKNHDDVKDLMKELKELKEQIKEQLEQATGYGLFGSFQTRQKAVARAKMFWAVAIVALLLISVAGTIWIATSTTDFKATAFYIKLSLSIPLVFAIGFCAVQYSTERQLEEEYAIRSNISFSLMPYQGLVEKLVNMEDATEKAKYSTFIIESITKVFASPTDKVFKSSSDRSNKSLKEMTTMIKSMMRAAKH
jgi:hypothetical protein